MAYMVKEVAEMAGISVRTLHHYDQIGLLRPETLSPSGYRLYGDGDIERLQQILFFKEIGLSLQEIGAILDSPRFDRKQALVRQKQLLGEQKRRIEQMIETVERTIASIEGGKTMSKQDLFRGLDMRAAEEHQRKYADEVRERYGVDPMARKEEWPEMLQRSGEISQEIANNMDKDPGDPAVQAVVDAWYKHINQSFFACTPEAFRGLADLYVQDERFTASIDAVKPGLAAFMRQAMHTYCDRM